MLIEAHKSYVSYDQRQYGICPPEKYDSLYGLFDQSAIDQFNQTICSPEVVNGTVLFKNIFNLNTKECLSKYEVKTEIVNK